MPRASRRIPAARLERLTRSLLRASTLCAISTVSAGGRAHVNTAYFAWGPRYEIVWISAPNARHSRNVARRRSVAIAVYDSRQTWGESDRGIQLFGSARRAVGPSARAAERLYGKRFHSYDPDDLQGYPPYVFRPTRVKLFDERALGGATFVTARVDRRGRLAWVRTEEYGSEQAARRERTL